MSSRNDLQALIIQKQRHLQKLQEQEARFGPSNAPAHLLLDIEDVERELADLETQLAAFPAPAAAESTPEVNPVSTPPATQPRPAVYAIAGLLAGAGVNIAINLLSAAIQQKYFAGQFTDQALWGLAIFAGVGLLVGLWLSGPISVPASTASPQVKPLPAGSPHQVTITRLKALLSYGKLRGRGVTLSDILLIGSKLDIDTRNNNGPSHH